MGHQPRPRLCQKPIGMSVVAALEFYYLVAPGKAPRRSYRAHNRLGSGVHKPQHLHRREVLLDKLRKLYLAPVAGSECKPAVACGFHCFGYLRYCMTQDIRTPGADVVDKFIAVLVVYL